MYLIKKSFLVSKKKELLNRVKHLMRSTTGIPILRSNKHFDCLCTFLRNTRHESNKLTRHRFLNSIRIRNSTQRNTSA